MIYLPGLAVAVAAFWFALSGQTTPLFLLLAVVSILATLWLCARLGIIDRDASPYHLAHLLVLYAGWLVVEIFKANVVVIRSVLDLRQTISPAVVKVPPDAKTDFGRALFANSITLTPGTVTIDIAGDLLVHVLHEENSQPASFALMNRMAARAADGWE
ncbi:MAG: cation:proton antiporter [Alphaproteobacteria bacterium]|nr:cation:proton antiporter [Alphaproteobacteria bacterium]